MKATKIYILIAQFVLGMSIGVAEDLSDKKQENLVIAKGYKNPPLTTTGKKYRRPRNTNKNNFTNFKYKPPTERKRMTNPSQNTQRGSDQ